MKPARFDYHRPKTLSEALMLLADLGPEARPLAGGQSLIPFMNFRLARPTALVDLNRVEGLGGIGEQGGAVELGAMTRQWDVEHSPIVARSCPMLPAALRWVGHTATRSRGTIGGSIAHADPAAELPTVAVALGAEMTMSESSGGTRQLPADEFFVDHYSTALEPGELLTKVRFPAQPAGSGWGFEEFSFRSGDFAIASAAVTLSVRDGRIDEAGVTLGAVGAKPLSAAEAAQVLTDAEPSPALWQAAGQAAAAEIDPLEDEIPAGYRRQVVATVVEDAAQAAWSRLGDNHV